MLGGGHSPVLAGVSQHTGPPGHRARWSHPFLSSDPTRVLESTSVRELQAVFWPDTSFQIRSVFPLRGRAAARDPLADIPFWTPISAVAAHHVFFLSLVVRYMGQKMDHLLHFSVYSSVVVTTFTVLGSHRHHPSPALFSSGSAGTTGRFY